MSASLSITVVGGGIGGLTSAVALRRAGHRVKVFEKSDFAHEAAFGVGIGAEAIRVWRRLGLSLEDAKLCKLVGMNVSKGETFDPVHVLDISDFEVRHGQPTCSAYRPDVQTALRHLATSEKGDGPPCELIAHMSVVEYDADEGFVKFADGQTVTADLVVASDGVHSKAMSHILGRQTAAMPSNTTVIRFILPIEELQKDEVLKHFALEKGKAILTIGEQEKNWMISYWVRDYTLMNFGLYAVGNVAEADAQELRFQATKESLKGELEGLPAGLTRLAEMTNDILPMWRCARRETYSSYFKGRLVVIGDAAHAMLPHLGVGAVASVLDAGALGALFTDMPSTSLEAISSRLALFDEIRPPHASVYQLYADVPYYMDNVALQRKEACKFMAAENLPASKADLQDWMARFDVYERCFEQLQQREAGKRDIA